MKLIPNWRKFWRMHSVQALGFIAAVQSVLLAVPSDRLTQQILSSYALTWGDLGFYLTMAAAGIGGLGRLIDQPKVQE